MRDEYRRRQSVDFSAAPSDISEPGDARARLEKMEFSVSTFVVEINGTACAAFQTKWQSEAETIGRDWAEHQLQHQLTDAPVWPPLIRVRIARPAERAAYQQTEGTENYRGVEFVTIGSVLAALGGG